MLAAQGRSKLLLPEWSAVLTTSGGLRLNVRSASPADEQELARFFDEATHEDLRFRFLSSMKAVAPEITRELVEVDHSRTENLLAFDARDGRLAATAMIAANEDQDSAEVAVIVRSDLKGRGVGWAMLDLACDYATARGFKSLHSVELGANFPGIALEEEMGFKGRPCPEDSSVMILTKTLATAGNGDTRRP